MLLLLLSAPEISDYLGDFRHHPFNKRRGHNTGATRRSPIRPVIYRETQRTPTHRLSALADPGIYGLSIKKILLQFGIRGQYLLNTGM